MNGNEHPNARARNPSACGVEYFKVELAVPQLNDKSPNQEFDASQTRNVSSTVWSTSTVLACQPRRSKGQGRALNDFVVDV
jgi:hypothetical protein